jgi:hypothetical protein
VLLRVLPGAAHLLRQGLFCPKVHRSQVRRGSARRRPERDGRQPHQGRLPLLRLHHQRRRRSPALRPRLQSFPLPSHPQIGNGVHQVRRKPAMTQ